MAPPITLAMIMVTLISLLTLWPSSRAEVTDMVAANAGFGYDLYSKISEQEDAENIFFSPYSISVAMAMTYLGSRGDTRAEIAEVMGFNSVSSVKLEFKELIEKLFIDNSDYSLKSANRFYAQDGLELESEFLADLEQFYGTSSELVDFARDTEGSRELINEWVEDETENNIRDLFPQGSIDATTILVLVNALYFKADWLIQFDPTLTHQDQFHTMRAEPVSVPFMKLEANLRMIRESDNKLSMLEIPYKGEGLAMYIVLPDNTSDLRAVETELTADKLSSLISSLGVPSKVDLQLPKFTITQKMSLPAIFEALGIQKAFSANLADFTGICKDSGIYVSEVIHQAYITINEEGTEASAATGVGVSFRKVTRSQPFHVNRPFVFVIRDLQTSTNLFMGRVANPETATQPLALRMLRSVSGSSPGGNTGEHRDTNGGLDVVAFSVLAMVVIAMVTYWVCQ